MRWLAALGSAFVMCIAPSIGIAQSGNANDGTRWRTIISVKEIGSVRGLDQLHDWINAGDLPLHLQNRPLDTSTQVRLADIVEGKPRNCLVTFASKEPDLDAVACRLLLDRAKLGQTRTGPGQSRYEDADIEIRWWTVTEQQFRQTAFAPPWPPSSHGYSYRHREWPRLKWNGGITVSRLVSLQDYYKAANGKNKSGMTSVDLIFKADTLSPECEIGVSSGSKELDAAACKAATATGFSYSEPCKICDTRYLPLQFVWKKKGSYLQMPAFNTYQNSFPESFNPDPSDPRPFPLFRPKKSAPIPPLNQSDFDFYDPLLISNERPRFAVDVDQAGKPTSCSTLISTGDLQIDSKFCEKLVDKARFDTMTDIFGNFIATRHLVSFRLERAKSMP